MEDKFDFFLEDKHNNVFQFDSITLDVHSQECLRYPK